MGGNPHLLAKLLQNPMIISVLVQEPLNSLQHNARTDFG